MAKVLVGNEGGYTFDASLKTITLTDLPTLTIEQILLVTNVTDGEVIYQFNDILRGGTIAANVITLTFDTTAMADSDDLQIWIDYPGAHDKGLLYSHQNTLETNTTLETKRNYYSDGMLLMASGVTLTIPSSTLLQIQ
tara:strand:+ start:207 stop:620 length:414 start_codon:yes stop_codon:yes gene_type:complete